MLIISDKTKQVRKYIYIFQIFVCSILALGIFNVYGDENVKNYSQDEFLIIGSVIQWGIHSNKLINDYSLYQRFDDVFFQSNAFIIDNVKFNKTLFFSVDKGLYNIMYFANVDQNTLKDSCLKINNYLNTIYGTEDHSALANGNTKGYNVSENDFVWNLLKNSTIEEHCASLKKGDKDESYIAIVLTPKWSVIDCYIENTAENYYLNEHNNTMRIFNDKMIGGIIKVTITDKNIFFIKDDPGAFVLIGNINRINGKITSISEYADGHSITVNGSCSFENP